MTFASLGLTKPVLEGVRLAGYTQPTDIQSQAIPLILGGKNLIGLGQTGSGKTAAFGLPILHKLAGGEPGLRALILVPTRELCVQVAESLRLYGQKTGLAVCTAFGGVGLGIQESAFKRGLDVLVACPGRLIDHLERGNLTLDRLQVLVLDEADRMLDMGFMPQIRKILLRCPQERQTCLFSATFPPEIEDLCARFVPDAARVQVGRRSQAAQTISHEFLQVTEGTKLATLGKLLREQRGRILVFVRTKIRAEQLGKKLAGMGLDVDSIHGDKDASTRYTILQKFDRGRLRCLVATDVAARGIDVDDIELVVNCDMPRALEDYVHRVGRTGRAGASGKALSLVTKADAGILKQVQQHVGVNGKPGAQVAADEPAGPAEPAARRERSEAPARERGQGSRSEGRGKRDRSGGRRQGADRDRESSEPRESRAPRESREPARTAKATATAEPAAPAPQRAPEPAVARAPRTAIPYEVTLPRRR